MTFPRLLLLSLVSLLSLLVFQSGFLLKRNELHLNSTCSDVKLQPGSCWFPKQYDKIVILLVDALRYDFLLPTTDFASNFRGQMPGVAKLLQQGAAVGTVLADPPTTTLQRIKGLTTGTLPTFIDSADNFSPSALVQEDNFVHQALRHNRTVRFFGDDTWFSLYPELAATGDGYPSFDVNDLDTVDEAVRAHLETHFEAEEEAELVVAHTLGVDHCGHKFGPTHPTMATILKRTDQLIYKTAMALRERQLLIVLGDHGMTSTGDHGGDSDDETHAGILLYSPGRQLQLTNARPLSQIDLVPTVSLLLGLPIPFSSLGIIIRDLFPPSLLPQAVELNYDQQMRFATTYAASNGFAELFEVTSRDSSTVEDQLWTMGRLQEVLRRAWTRFDWPRMRTGLVSLLEVTLFHFSGRALDVPEVVFRTGCVLLQYSVWMQSSGEDSLAFPLMMLVLPLSICYSLGCLVIRLSTLDWSRSTVAVSAALAVSLHAVSYTSNSYVVYGAQTVRYLLEGVVTVAAWQQLGSYWRKAAVAGGRGGGGVGLLGFFKTKQGYSTATALLLLRLEPIFHRCREEEVDCQMSFMPQMLGAVSTDARFWRLCLSWSSLALYHWLVSPRRGILGAVSRLAFVLIGLHQLVQLAITSAVSTAPALPAAGIFLALGVYFLTTVAVSLVFVYRREASQFEVGQQTAFAISWSLLLLLGDGMVPAFLAFVALFTAVLSLSDGDSLPWTASLLLSLGFYYTGHSPTLPAIPWTAGFVGLPGNFFLKAAPAVLILSHLFGTTVFLVLVLPLHPHFGSFPALLAAASLRPLAVSLAALLHRRHLMVWKIFAPNFIFEAVGFVVLVVVVLIRQSLISRQITSQ